MAWRPSTGSIRSLAPGTNQLSSLLCVFTSRSRIRYQEHQRGPLYTPCIKDYKSRWVTLHYRWATAKMVRTTLFVGFRQGGLDYTICGLQPRWDGLHCMWITAKVVWTTSYVCYSQARWARLHCMWATANVGLTTQYVGCSEGGLHYEGCGLHPRWAGPHYV